MTSTEKRLRAKLESLAEEVSQTREHLDEVLRHKRILCTHCKRRTEVRFLVYEQTHWYVPPRGCTEGDYWREGEGRFRCPKCSKQNRLYNRPEVVALERYFASKEKTYNR